MAKLSSSSWVLGAFFNDSVICRNLFRLKVVSSARVGLMVTNVLFPFQIISGNICEKSSFIPNIGGQVDYGARARKKRCHLSFNFKDWMYFG